MLLVIRQSEDKRKITAGKTRFNIVYYPKRKTFQEKLAQMLGSGPKISVNKVVNDFGFGTNDINMLNRMKYDTVLPPFRIVY